MAGSRAFSREAWALLAPSFSIVLNEPDNLQARSDMQLGAMFAGLAIENSMLGSAHATANPLTATYGVVHGEAVGLMLPHIIRHNGQTIESWYQELTGHSAHDLANLVGDLRQKAGLAGTLGECGVEHERLSQLAAAATEQWTGTFNPVEMSQDDFLQVYEAAC